MQRRVHTVLYDDGCPLCTFQMKLLTWLDWGNRLSLRPISDPAAAGLAPSITPEALHEAIHCVTPEGRVYRGARCIRFVGLRLPLLAPVALGLWLPGVIQLAEVVYRWVSRNRHLISRLFGCREACSWVPTRERSQDAPPAAPESVEKP